MRFARVARMVFGGLIGVVVSAIVAVNLVIFLGVPGGYEAGLGDVFRHSPLLGALVVAVLVAGPVLGILAGRRSGRIRG